jgi:hypothetical protein
MGTAVLGFDSSTVGICVFDHTGSPLVIGRAGIASASSAVSNVSFAASGVAGASVCAHTGVVSRVGTAVTGFSCAGSGGGVASRVGTAVTGFSSTGSGGGVVSRVGTAVTGLSCTGSGGFDGGGASGSFSNFWSV